MDASRLSSRIGRALLLAYHKYISYLIKRFFHAMPFLAPQNPFADLIDW
jgi:hypothetical protein